MEQPQSHYQVSFTVRQALLLFVGLLLALALAYFFGLMTGLSGRPSEVAAGTAEPTPARSGQRGAAAPAASATPAATAEPARSPEARRAAAEPTAPAELQLFEDAGEPTPPPRRVLARGATPGLAAAPAPVPAPKAGEFWVQVLSVSSEREARQRRELLTRHKFPAAVVPGDTPRGKVYRVRVGPYRSRDEAARAATELKSREKVEPWIVPSGQ